MDRLIARYNEAEGEKAEELRLRAEKHMKTIEEGQILNRKALDKLEERTQRVLSDKEKMTLEKKEVNDKSGLVRHKV